ncbi:MAG: phage tail protein [Bdellovibrionota bacterium]
MFGSSKPYYKKFKFVVEIDGIARSAFQKCSQLEAEIAIIEQWEGGALTADKSLGRVKFSNVTLERGATDDLNVPMLEIARAKFKAGEWDNTSDENVLESIELAIDGFDLAA